MPKGHPLINEERDGLLICAKCEQWKSRDVFTAAPRMKRGVHSWCRQCQTKNAEVWLTPEKRAERNTQKRARYDAAAAKTKREANYEHVRRLERKSRLARKYSMTLEEYEQRWQAQQGRCLICTQEKDLHVDHCHVGGQVRGLLCRSCNTGLGLYKDDPERLRRAAAYVEENR